MTAGFAYFSAALLLLTVLCAYLLLRSRLGKKRTHPSALMPTSIRVDSRTYVCFHEAGHAVATYLENGTVDFVELILSPEGRLGGRTRVNRATSSEGRTIASAGFAAEYLLFKAGRIVDSLGVQISEKAFIDASMNNAREDKVSFFGIDHMRNGLWPEHMDREYMFYAMNRVAPKLSPAFAKLEMFAVALEAQSRLDRAEIEAIFL